ncbi:MAG: stage V sporulation protein D, partial [Acutalibacteraceae bacterium]
MSEKNSKKLSERTAWLLFIILVLGFGTAIFRIGYLQLFKGEELKQSAVEQQLGDTEISAKRGTIYDCNGNVLAQSASVWRVVLAPAYFETNKERRIVAKGLRS